jgi:4-hydroxy 2-oxovalerate aldolase
MSKFSLLDCTLRDGGYITSWNFTDFTICDMIKGLDDAHIDYIECGYLNSLEHRKDSTIFQNIDSISKFLPRHKSAFFLAMADFTQFKKADITPYDGNSIEGIRVVFYKHQIMEAIDFAKEVVKKGYKLFMQPMVTIDYHLDEYAALVNRIAEIKPHCISLVDSFGYMTHEEFRRYYNVLDNLLSPEIMVGFHSHENMQFAFSVAQDVLKYNTSRRLVIDASLYGIGRGAGNLCTETIANYYNNFLGQKYDIRILMRLLNDYIMPIRKTKEWGFSPYLFLTGLHKCHPNFACYLLEKHNISVSDFEKFLLMIPSEMRTKCRRPYVEELYQQFVNSNNTNSKSGD